MPPSMLDVAARRPAPSVVVIQVGRVLFGLLWLCWAVLAWWAAPRPTDAQVARADLAAGRVVEFARIDGWDTQRGFWGLPATPRHHPDGVMLWWRTANGQERFAAPDRDLAPAQLRGFGGVGDSAQVSALVGEMRSANVPESSTTLLSNVARGLAATVAGVGFLILVLGPAPVRGTRPFWFWIGMLPFGLGALAWLAVERPWSRRAYRVEADAARRRPGLMGFLMLFVVGFAVNLVVVGLQAVLPISLIA